MKQRKRATMPRIILLAGWLLVAGCASRPEMESVDGQTNYSYVFAGMEAPRPMVVNSRVERERKSVLGIVPLNSEYNGLWEFEVLASRAWVNEVMRGAGGIPYSEIAFDDAGIRQVPDWFRPTAEEFSAWKLQGSLSYARAHLFIERAPESEERIRVFVRRF
jgi:hypothetical protein